MAAAFPRLNYRLLCHQTKKKIYSQFNSKYINRNVLNRNNIFISNITNYHNFCSKPKDDMKWLYDVTSKPFKNFLKQEEKYHRQIMKKSRPFQEILTKELYNRLDTAEHTLPEEIRGYSYYLKREPDKNYPIYCRKKEDNLEEILIDQNEFCHSSDFNSIGTLKISHDNRYCAYTVDKNGNEIYSIHIKDMETNKIILNKHMKNCLSIEWGSCITHHILFYTICDNKRRPYCVYKHILEDKSDDELIYKEEDDSYFLDVNLTKDSKYITISSNSKCSSEVRVIDATKVTGKTILLRKRSKDVEYFVEHANNSFFIVTNCDKAVNYKVVKQEDNKTNVWETLVEESITTKIEDIDVFQDFFVLYERKEGIPQIRVVPNYDLKQAKVIQLPENQRNGVIHPGVNRDFVCTKLRFSISTPLIPQISYDYNYRNDQLILLRETLIQGIPKMEPKDYICERIFAISRDNIQVPVTLIYKKEIEKNGNNPILLHAYGAYGINTEMEFMPDKLTLLERGWILALAHVRGGGELGLQWHQDGKLLKKKNSFYDFISCAEMLIKKNYTTSSLLAGYGTSAGGLIMAYVANERPDLFKAMILKVPFVDILNTMLDNTLPLTVHEYDEWGDPRESIVYDYIQSYSPVEQVKKQNYPALYITGSMNDSRVNYWEPAKLVASLRELNGFSNLLLLRMSFTDNHFGASGKLEYLEQAAVEQAFLYQALGLRQK